MGAQKLCNKKDLVINSGVCALAQVNGQPQQLAVFYLPDTEQQVFAIHNWDPLGRANVLSRGIIGSLGGKLVVASPVYKQHFCLRTGICLEDMSVSIPTWSVAVRQGRVLVAEGAH